MNEQIRTLAIKSIDHDIKIRFTGPDKKQFLLRGFEANLVKTLREFPAESRIKLMNLSEKECLDYFKEKRSSYRTYVLELFSKKWYDRETDIKFTLKDFECDFIEGRPTFQKVKNDVKKDKLTIGELSKLVNYFTDDFSELYCKE